MLVASEGSSIDKERLASTRRVLSGLLIDVLLIHRLLQEFHYHAGLILPEVAKEPLRHLFLELGYFSGGIAALRRDLDHVRPFVGIILAAENVLLLLEALQCPSRIGSVDENHTRQRILPGGAAFLSQQRQQPDFRVVEPQGGKASLGGLIPPPGEHADQIEECLKIAHV